MELINEMDLTFDAISVNESFARAVVASFCVQLGPTLEEITDIKTAVSEAVTNCVVHAYPKKQGKVTIKVQLTSCSAIISVIDNGVGIADYQKAREPFYTSKPEQERSGMGFTVMESFMNKVELSSNNGKGLVVKMEKQFSSSIKKAVG